MRSSRLVVVATIAVALALTTASYAQGQGRGGQGRGGPGGRMFGGMRGFGMDQTALLRSEKVKTEIKITEEQAPKVDEILAAHTEAARELRGPRTGRGRGGDDAERPSAEEREKQRAEAAKKRAALLKTTMGKLAKVLNKDQVARLNGITLQMQGTSALTADWVVAALKLEKKQVEKIKAAFTTRDEENRKLFEEMRGQGRQGGREAFEGMREKMQAIRKKADDAALACLTEEQQKKLTEMKGAEIDRSELFPRRGGQFGGGRRGSGEGGEAGGRRRGGSEGGQEGGRRRRPPVEE